MPYIGLLKPKYCPVTKSTDSNGNETETYGEVKVLAKAVTASTTINTSKTKFYADDSVAESVNEFINGNITLQVDDLSNEVLADICGASISTDTGDITMRDTDTAAMIRLGFLVRRYKNDKSEYRGIVFSRIVFDIPADDYETKGESIVSKSTTITGEIMRNHEHIWKDMSAWKTNEQDALDWVNTKLKPTPISASL